MFPVLNLAHFGTFFVKIYIKTHDTNKTILVRSNVRCSTPSKRVMNPSPEGRNHIRSALAEMVSCTPMQKTDRHVGQLV